MKKLLTLLLFIFCVGITFGQEKKDLNALSEAERVEITETALREIKNGTAALIVRLPSNHKKMTELERLSQSKDLDGQQIARMNELLTVTRGITPAFNGRLMTAFAENFNFTQPLFMHDTASVSLKNGVKSGIFLDKSIQPSKNITLAADKYYILNVDYDGFPKAMNVTDFDMLNANLEKLPAPFPQNARGGFFLNMGLLFNSDIAEKQAKVMSAMTEKYNGKLYKAYERFIEN